MGVPALRVRLAQPADETRQGAIGLGPQHEVPVIGHQAVGQHTHRHLLLGLDENAEEGVEVGGLVQEGSAGVAPIEHVVDVAAFCQS